MWVSTVLGDMYSWPAMAWLERPSAIRASTASSRSVSVCRGLSRRGRVTSRDTRGPPPDRVGELGDVRDPFFEHVPDPARIVGQQLEQVLGLDVL